LVLAISDSATTWAQDAPVVSNVAASQRPDDSKLVDIYYDLADESLCTVWVVVSDDAGKTWSVPAQTFTGDVGPDIQPGTGKHIVWDAGADIPGKTGTLKVRVYADDGNGQANMVFVPAGSFPYQQGEPVYVAAFWIDKYEVTNLRYCEFLNAGDNDDHWVPEMEITRHGDEPPYTYAVDNGRQNYPIRYVNYYDCEAFAAWLSARELRNYRLPTEEEWEKAAAWDPVEEHHYLYGFHQDSGMDCSWCNYKPDDYCVGDTTEVGHYNGTDGTNDAKCYYGCYDMSGNVCEWTSSMPSQGVRIERGGAYNMSAAACQTTWANGTPETARVDRRGFRLVLDLE